MGPNLNNGMWELDKNMDLVRKLRIGNRCISFVNQSALLSRKSVVAEAVVYSRKLCLRTPWVTGDNVYHTSAQPLIHHMIHIVT